jgi:hypothetical protein
MECDGFRLTLKVFSFPRNAARLDTSRKLEVTICNFCNHDLRIRDIIECSMVTMFTWQVPSKSSALPGGRGTEEHGRQVSSPRVSKG